MEMLYDKECFKIGVMLHEGNICSFSRSLKGSLHPEVHFEILMIHFLTNYFKVLSKPNNNFSILTNY